MILSKFQDYLTLTHLVQKVDLFCLKHPFIALDNLSLVKWLGSALVIACRGEGCIAITCLGVTILVIRDCILEPGGDVGAIGGVLALWDGTSENRQLYYLKLPQKFYSTNKRFLEWITKHGYLTYCLSSEFLSEKRIHKELYLQKG